MSVGSRKALGALIAAAPFVAIFALIGVQDGWWVPFADLAVMAVVLGCLTVGIRLIESTGVRRQAESDLPNDLRHLARAEFDRNGPDDPRGAAIWDVAAWIEERRK